MSTVYTRVENGKESVYQNEYEVVSSLSKVFVDGKFWFDVLKDKGEISVGPYDFKVTEVKEDGEA